MRPFLERERSETRDRQTGKYRDRRRDRLRKRETKRDRLVGVRMDESLYLFNIQYS